MWRSSSAFWAITASTIRSAAAARRKTRLRALDQLYRTQYRRHHGPYELVSKMRASFWVIGPLLARMGEAKVSLPGGCAIGTRPVDLFLEGLQALGAEIDVEAGYVGRNRQGSAEGQPLRVSESFRRRDARADDGGALARGETVLENAAREPEIVNLADCLNAMGAKIAGAGTPTITIQGVDSLSGASIGSFRTVSRPAPMRWRWRWPAAMCCWSMRGRISWKSAQRDSPDRRRSHRAQ